MNRTRQVFRRSVDCVCGMSLPPQASHRRRPRRTCSRITFVPQADTFAAAAREYGATRGRREGPRIVAAMERLSGLTFVSSVYADTVITANVLERASNSGYRGHRCILARAIRSTRRSATLIHELGHRLQSGLFRREEEEHGWLFLWIYDVWVSLYGAGIRGCAGAPSSAREADRIRKRVGRSAGLDASSVRSKWRGDRRGEDADASMNMGEQRYVALRLVDATGASRESIVGSVSPRGPSSRALPRA